MNQKTEITGSASVWQLGVRELRDELRAALEAIGRGQTVVVVDKRRGGVPLAELAPVSDGLRQRISEVA